MLSSTKDSADYEPIKSSYTDFDAEYDTSDVAPSQSIKRPLRRIVIILAIVVQVVFDFLVIANAIYDTVHPHRVSPYPVAQRLYCRYSLACLLYDLFSTSTLLLLS